MPSPIHLPRCTILSVAFLVALAGTTHPALAQPWNNANVVASYPLQLPGGTLQVDFAAGTLDLGQAPILDHIHKAAAAVVAYFGQYPVKTARILVVPMPDRSGDPQGTTWGGVGGYQGFIRLRVGEHTTQAQLDSDWVTTHEMVHLAFPSQEREQHWMEEGMATYVEPIARVMTGELTAEKIWADMFRDMHQGEPQPTDQGLDHTHTWGSTYWGGALFCLSADVAIRRETHNRKGLIDAFRAIVAAGGAIDQDWPLDKAFSLGDQATGTHVLTDMYAKAKDAPVTVDLDKLWSDLGIQKTGDGITFVNSAPEAKIRQAITAKR